VIFFKSWHNVDFFPFSQFAEYQKREMLRKTKKIRSLFEHLSEEEVAMALSEGNEDEVS